MPIEMPRGVPFSVDTWTPSSKQKRHHFLTHAHKDHAQGIIAHASFPIYSTLFTKTLLLAYYPKLDESMFVGIEVGQSLLLHDPDGDFVVTAFDANHCPGSVMFLFEGNFGNILHTGDCRLTPECLQILPDKYIGKNGKGPRCTLDYIFLDCTFGQFPQKIPSRHTAIQQVINCIWKHPDAPTVYLTCDLLGQEEILLEVQQTFGDKLYVDKEKHFEFCKALELTVPEIISDDPSSRFHLFDGFPNLCERAKAKIAEARANFQNEPLIIRPSTQWYACDEGYSEMETRIKERFDQAVRDLHGIWHVCYSIHSSRDELEWALQLLAPRWVVSTTPSCRAMELDYVKKHCFNNRRAFDDSLWRLMDISSVASLDPDISLKENYNSNVLESISNSSETQSESVVISTRQRNPLNLSPPSKRPMITLFGRARLGSREPTFQYEQKGVASTSGDSLAIRFIESTDVSMKRKNVSEEKYEELTENIERVDFTETKCTKTVETHKATVISPTGLSKSYNENTRKYYRSMNVPVPQPLPSLVKLMDAINMRKRGRILRFSNTDKVPSSSYMTK